MDIRFSGHDSRAFGSDLQVTLIDVGISIAIENALGRMIKELGQILGVLG